ncbi:MAG: transcriptional repressor [Clostridia bacterium]|nr:transcriptional repressor [Clostridia bacterium]
MSRYSTRQRKALLTFLSEHPDELFSAGQIADGLSGEQISLSAVYRNLTELESEGKVRRSSKGGIREMFYQYTDAESCKGCIHLSCTKCGKTAHLNTSVTQQLINQVAQKDGFDLDEGETVLYGVCEGCRRP